MERTIRKAGVIGSGVMGATIAAQLANVGIETILLDIVPLELNEKEKQSGLTAESTVFRNRLADNGVKRALQSKPASFYVQENSRLITTGNIEDDLELLKKVDLM